MTDSQRPPISSSVPPVPSRVPPPPPGRPMVGQVPPGMAPQAPPQMSSQTMPMAQPANLAGNPAGNPAANPAGNPAARAAGHRPAPPPTAMRGRKPSAGQPTMAQLVREAFDKGFSDVHTGVGEVPRFRNRGEIETTNYPETDLETFMSWLKEILSD